MKKKYLFGLALIIAISATIAFFVFQANSASAKDRTFKEVFFPQNPQTSPDSQAAIATQIPETDPTPTVFPEGMLNPPTQESFYMLNDAEQMNKNADVVTQVKALLEKSEFLSATSIWTHSSVKTDVFISMSDKMPDGSPMPMAYTTDNWYRLDEKGYLIQGITMVDTGFPETFQVTVYREGIWYNLILGTSTDTGNPLDIKPYRPADHTILEQALLSKDSVRLDFEYAEINDQHVAVYTMIHEENTAPREIGIPRLPDKGLCL